MVEITAPSTPIPPHGMLNERLENDIALMWKHPYELYLLSDAYRGENSQDARYI